MQYILTHSCTVTANCDTVVIVYAVLPVTGPAKITSYMISKIASYIYLWLSLVLNAISHFC